MVGRVELAADWLEEVGVVWIAQKALTFCVGVVADGQQLLHPSIQAAAARLRNVQVKQDVHRRRWKSRQRMVLLE